jgi:hypothetical protein
MNSIAKNKYPLDNIFQYIIELIVFIFGIIFFGSKKNNRKIIAKIVPLSESDEKFGYNNIQYHNDIFIGYENIPLNQSVIQKKIVSEKIS